MPSFNGVRSERVGVKGMSIIPGDPEQSPWIENLTRLQDGSWRPRYGLRLIKDFIGRICVLGSSYQPKTSIMRHYVYVGVESYFDDIGGDASTFVGPGGVISGTPLLFKMFRIYQGTINTIASDTGQNLSAIEPTEFEDGQKNAVVAVGTPSNPTSTERRFLFSFTGIGSSGAYDNPTIYDQDGFDLVDGGSNSIKGAPFTHGNTSCVIAKTVLLWSAYGDVSNAGWDTATRYTYLPPELGEGVWGCYWQEGASFLAGTQGLCSIQGNLLDTDLSFHFLSAPPAAGNSAAVVTKCRERIFYMAPGPTLYSLGGGLQRIDAPIYEYLKDYDEVSTFQGFYDQLTESYCLSANQSGANYTFLYSLSDNAWISVYSFADSDKVIAKAVSVGPNTSDDAKWFNEAPYTASVVAVSNLLCRYDTSLATDETSSGVFTAFPCVIETAPRGSDSPEIDKRLLSVFVDGSGTWTVKMRHRTGGGDYTEETIGSVSAPGWVHASSETVYREMKIRLEANSSTTLRFKSVEIKEHLLGG